MSIFNKNNLEELCPSHSACIILDLKIVPTQVNVCKRKTLPQVQGTVFTYFYIILASVNLYIYL